MKILLVALLVSSVNLRAQVDINIQSANNYTMSMVKNHGPKEEGYFGKTFSLSSRLPKSRKLTVVEKTQKKLLQCIEGILNEYKGGDRAPIYAQKILLSAFDGMRLSKNISKLESINNECLRLSFELISSKNPVDYDTITLPGHNTAEISAANIIMDLAQKKNVVCYAPGLRIEGGFILIPRVGLTNPKCLLSNGVVRRYIGAEIGGGFLGIGGSVNLQSIELDSESMNAGGIIGGYAYVTPEDNLDEGLQLPIGTLEMDNAEITKGPSFGLGLRPILNLRLGAGIRIFNGKRRWSWLLDKLN